MKRFLSLLRASGVLLLPALVLGHGNERGVATAELGASKLTVDHGRPKANGRDVLALIKPGSYWRMGSDAATTLTTEVDLKFGDKIVAKGKYTLLAHFVEAGQWSLVVAQGASPTGEPAGLVAEVPGSITRIEPVETMTIKLETQGGRGRIVVEWGTSRLTAEFSAA